MPIMREDFETAVERSSKAEAYMQTSLVKMFQMKRLRELFIVLKRNRLRQQQENKWCKNMLNHFRRAEMFKAIRIWRRKTLEKKELTRKDSLLGADLRLKVF